MELQKVRYQIANFMALFQAELDHHTAMRLADIKVISQAVLVPLLTELYGLSSLKELDITEQENFPAVDLGDEENRIAFQITSVKTSAKIQDGLNKFARLTCICAADAGGA